MQGHHSQIIVKYVCFGRQARFSFPYPQADSKVAILARESHHIMSVFLECTWFSLISFQAGSKEGQVQRAWWW